MNNYHQALVSSAAWYFGVLGN